MMFIIQKYMDSFHIRAVLSPFYCNRLIPDTIPIWYDQGNEIA